MSAQTVALTIVAAVIAATVIFGLFGVRRLHMTPDQFIVGGRSFGAFLLWLLMAGEIYTSFTFLGAAGWAYGKGAPAFYILCYGTVAFAISYFLAPALWRIAKERNLLTIGDFFADRYGSKALAAIVALTGIIFLVPYVTLQLSGLQILLSIAGYHTFDARAAVGAAFVVATLFVFVCGLRGTAWASIVKDALVLAAVIFAGVYLPVHFFGSPASVISRVLERQPHWFALAHGSAPNGTLWFMSTVALTALGFFMWPQSANAVFSAKSDDALRRNAIFLPLYQLMLLLVYFAGFTALLLVPGLKGGDADQSFMLVVQRYFSPAVLGAVAAAGCLAALVPVTSQLLGAAGLFTQNLYAYAFGKPADATNTTITRIVILVVAVGALGFWLIRPPTLVELLLLGYNGVTQFFPGVVLAFCWRGASAWGVGAGIVAGIVTLIALAKSTGVYGLNPGLVALCVNTVICLTISALASRRGTKAGAAAPLSETRWPR